MPYSNVKVPVDKYLKYNEVTNRLEANKPLQTTLNSYYLGEQHKMSSGGENVFFTNLTSEIDWYPMWGGIRDHSQAVNQGPNGLVAPSARVYGAYQEVEFYGPVSTGSVAYAGATSSALESASIFGLEFVLAEPVDEELVYRAYYGLDGSGNEVYLQRKNILGVEGDVIEWWFDHPLEVHPPTDVFSTITKLLGDPLLVRPGSVIPTHHYVKLKGRTFKDKDLEYISPYEHLTSMDFTQDDTGSSIIFTDPVTQQALRPFFINEVKAVENNGAIRVYLKDGLKVYIEALAVDSTYIEGNLVTQVLSTAVNELNSLFTHTGTHTNGLPNITSSMSVAITSGDSVNYTLVGDFGSEVVWDLTNVPGVVTTTGDRRRIIGGTLLGPGSYNIPVTMINSNGEDSGVLVLTVSNLPYSNTRSMLLSNGDLCTGLAETSNPMYRIANGAGAGDSWSIAIWIKGGTSLNSKQTLVSFGGSSSTQEGRVELVWDNSVGNSCIRLKYGSKLEYIQVSTPDNSLPGGVWKHLLVTYSGGTTGSNQADIADYYSRFGIWVDGVSQVVVGSQAGDGYSEDISNELFFIGESVTGGDNLRDVYLDEVAIWGNDQTANATSIYNTGTTHDLEILPSPPTHYWQMGDGDIYPTIADKVNGLDLTMHNMTINNLVNDVP